MKNCRNLNTLVASLLVLEQGWFSGFGNAQWLCKRLAVALGWATLPCFRNFLGVLKSLKTTSFGKGHKSHRPPNDAAPAAEHPEGPRSRHRERFPPPSPSAPGHSPRGTDMHLFLRKPYMSVQKALPAHTRSETSRNILGPATARPEVRGRRPH